MGRSVVGTGGGGDRGPKFGQPQIFETWFGNERIILRLMLYVDTGVTPRYGITIVVNRSW